jgi:hypothetical protein
MDPKLLFVIVICAALPGCRPPLEPTCPTGRVSCDCAELERMTPAEDVAEQIAALRDLSDPALQGPVAAATDLERRCRGGARWIDALPPEAERDAAWRARCTAAEPALPALLHALEAIEERRGSRANTEREDLLEDRVVAALGTIALGNPATVCRESAIGALLAVVEAPESSQDLRINLTALRLLGQLGDGRAAPALVRALFVSSERRPLSLREPARTALQRLDDLEVAATALVAAGRLEDEELRRREDLAPDPRDVKEQVALTLGQLGVASDEVVSYLMAELAHDAPDEVDQAPSRGRVSFTPALSRAARRSHAARALGRLRHLPALDVILPRLALNEDGSSVDRSVNIAEVPGYLEAAGDFLAPARTDAALLLWLDRGDETLRDIAGRRLYLQSGAGAGAGAGTSVDLAARLARAVSTLPECAPAATGCVRRNFEQDYVPALRASEGCVEAECWREALAAEGSSDALRMRAATQLVMLGRGERATLDALLAALPGAAAGAPFEALITAIDRLSPSGCEQCPARLLELLESRSGAGEAADTQENRLTTALLGRLRFRARR